MNSRELLIKTLKGNAIPRYPSGPLAVHYCARLAGYTLKEYTLNPKILSECVIRYYEQFKPDAVWISADTWVTAEAMGAAVAFPDENQPLSGTGEPLVKNRHDIDRISAPDIENQGRFPVMLEALSRTVEQIGQEVFIVGCFDQSPFSLACQLMGMDNAMIALKTDTELLNRVMSRAIEYCIAYGTAMARAGADMLSTGDSPAGLIGSRLYRQFVLPAEQQVFLALKEKTDAFLSLHICGDATDILDDMILSGADVLEIDSLIKMRDACRIVPNQITLWGNLDPVKLLQNGTVKRVRQELNRILNVCRRFHRKKMVLSSGCTLSLDTKAENLSALVSKHFDNVAT